MRPRNNGSCPLLLIAMVVLLGTWLAAQNRLPRRSSLQTTPRRHRQDTASPSQSGASQNTDCLRRARRPKPRKAASTSSRRKLTRLRCTPPWLTTTTAWSPISPATTFTVFEDGKPQKITSFRREDIPVAMGIVIDNSGSMREKRPAVNAAAINLVKGQQSAGQGFHRQLQRGVFPRSGLHRQHSQAQGRPGAHRGARRHGAV